MHRITRTSSRHGIVLRNAVAGLSWVGLAATVKAILCVWPCVAVRVAVYVWLCMAVCVAARAAVGVAKMAT